MPLPCDRAIEFRATDGAVYVLDHASLSRTRAAPGQRVDPSEAARVVQHSLCDLDGRLLGLWSHRRGRFGGGAHAPERRWVRQQVIDELRRPAGMLRLYRISGALPVPTWGSLEDVPFLRDLAEEPIEDTPLPATPSPEPEPEPEPHWIELHVVHENGVPFPELTVELELPDGSSRLQVLDTDARLRLDDLPNPTSCRVRFPDGVFLPPYAERPAPSPLEPGPNDRSVSAIDVSGDGVALAVDQAHRLVVRRPTVSVVQLSEIQFGLARAIVLPEPALDPDAPESDLETDETPRITPLSAIASALGFATTGERPRRVLVAGHTDTTGSDASNLTLSEARARNVQLAMAGDHGGWAQHCQGHYAVDDVQRILQWVAREQGWACDPGEADNDLGPKTRTALDAFREAFNHHWAGNLSPGTSVGLPDWEAFAALYDQAIGNVLSALGYIDDIRQAVGWTSPEVVGCGEAFPVEATALDEYVSASNRRVDILFFDDFEIPDIAATPPGVDIYGSDRYRAEPVPVEPWQPGQSLDYEVWVQLHDQWRHAALAQQAYRLVGPLPDRTYDRRGTTDAEGNLREQELPWGDYWVQVQGKGVFCGARYIGHDPRDHADPHIVPGLGLASVPARPERTQPDWEVPVTGIDELAYTADIFDPDFFDDDDDDDDNDDSDDDDAAAPQAPTG